MGKLRNFAFKDLHFNPKILADGDVRIALDETAIGQSIISILTTKKGDRVMLPSFGSDVWSLLFEQMDDITESKIIDAVDSSIREWEPRIVLKDVKVIANEDQNTYNVKIDFTLKGVTTLGIRTLNIELRR